MVDLPSVVSIIALTAIVTTISVRVNPLTVVFDCIFPLVVSLPDLDLLVVIGAPSVRAFGS